MTALCNERGYCWATNRYFAELYGVEKETISRWVASLVKGGYVTIETIYKEGTKEVLQRQIRLADPLLTKKSIPPCAKDQQPIDEKRKENTTGNIPSVNVIPFSTKTGETPFPKEKDLPPKAEEHNLAAATIWRIGVGLLIDQGIPEPQARSLLGKYAKEFGKEAVAGVIGRMSADPPVNCVTYLAKVFATKEVKKNPTNRELIRREQEWILQDNATTVH